MGLGIITLFICCGLLSGFFAGLLGIGGGMITVPALYYLFSYAGYPSDEIMQVAIGTSLAATFITASGSAWAHHLKKGIAVPPLLHLIPGLIIGSLMGVLLADLLPGSLLRVLFGCMAILFGLYYFFPRLPHFNFGPLNYTLSLFALVIGALSSLLGIGGGIFTLPVLLGYQLPMKNGIATAAVSTCITALVGSLFYLFIGHHPHPLPYSLGYIHLPSFFSIGLASICTVPLGAHLSHTLDTHVIKRILSCIFIAAGLLMLFR